MLNVPIIGDFILVCQKFKNWEGEWMQVLLAIGVGATYAAPYLNRMNTVDKPGMEYIKNMQV